MVKMNSFMGTVSNENTTTTSIKMFDKAALDRATRPAQPQSQSKQAWTGNK